MKNKLNNYTDAKAKDLSDIMESLKNKTNNIGEKISNFTHNTQDLINNNTK